MPANEIRPIAICVCRDGDRILAAEYQENGRLYYRPLGGGIEFYEYGVETVRREFREEISAELADIDYLGTLENIYSIDGERCHQIVLVFDAKLMDENLYEQNSIQGDELGESFRAVWKKLEEFGPEKPPLYPDGLLKLLTNNSNV